MTNKYFERKAKKDNWTEKEIETFNRACQEHNEINDVYIAALNELCSNDKVSLTYYENKNDDFNQKSYNAFELTTKFGKIFISVHSAMNALSAKSLHEWEKDFELIKEIVSVVNAMKELTYEFYCGEPQIEILQDLYKKRENVEGSVIYISRVESELINLVLTDEDRAMLLLES
ncbi:MAG: hypothetical protein J1E85_06370 [Ruminococcus sp.]|nr:hypothetical protein [Ruminococcus sp.]